MKTTVKKLSATKAELTIKLDKVDLLPAKAAALKKLAPTVTIAGFRKGKAPIELVESHVSSNILLDEVLNAAVQLTVINALNAEDIKALTLPEVNVTKFVPEDILEYTAVVEHWPEVKLGDYKHLKVKKPEFKVKDSDITDVLNRIAENYRTRELVKAPAASGHEVMIDFTGKLNGEAFKGGSAKDYALVLGSESFIPGFESGIIGHSAGDEFDLKLTFPKDYHAKNLAGQAVVFTVKLKSVNQLQDPTIDDAFASKCSPFKTLKELKEDIKTNLSLQNERSALEQYKDALTLELLKQSKIPVPEVILNDHLDFAKRQESENAARNGLSLDDYIAATGGTKEKWEKDLLDVATKRAEAIIALRTVAELEKITVTDEQLDQVLIDLRRTYGKSKQAAKDLKNPAVINDIKNRLLVDNTYNFLITANSSAPAKKSV